LQDSLSGGTRKVSLNVAGGTFTLGGANTFSGETPLIGGLLTLTNSAALQNNTLNLHFSDTRAPSFGPLTAATFGGLKGDRDLALTNASAAAVALRVGNGNTNTFSYFGDLTGSGSLTKAGAGTFILGGNNTFSGTLNVDTASTSADD